MITKTNQKAHEMSLIILETYVPENHLLRRVDQSIDFRFIYELVEPLYSKIGRPSIDPIQLFKLLFINHLYGYNSMRRTIEETKVNLAYRWFIGLVYWGLIFYINGGQDERKRRNCLSIKVI